MLREFLVWCFELLQADDVRLGLYEPAQQHRETAVNAVHVEGRDLHLSNFGCNRAGVIESRCGSASIRRKITPDGPGIRGMSDKIGELQRKYVDDGQDTLDREQQGQGSR
jgi:hypothetical protein